MNLNHAVVDFVKVSEVVIPDAFFNRIKTEVDEIDAIFGDGILPGMTATIMAKPGVGKSIFCLTLGELLVNKDYSVGYASGEEAVAQIAYNCRRLNITNLPISTKTDVDELAQKIEELDVLIIDSFQCLTEKNGLNSKARIKYFIDTLVKKAKDASCAIIFIVQMNVDGTIKGGTTLPYAVDCNILIQKDKDLPSSHRIISTYKNRFGATLDHLAEMTESGYMFMGEHNGEVSEDEGKEKTKRGSVGDQRKAMILEMTDPPHITMNRVMSELDIQKQTAYNLLRELEADGKIKKFGRGEFAIWKNNSVDDASFLEQCVSTLEKLI
jgi:predicted ATP-dependent serine protease